MINLNRVSEGEGEMIWNADLLIAASANAVTKVALVTLDEDSEKLENWA